MRSALVFGGSGQIGVPVTERLLANGWQVVAVSRTAQADRERLTWLRGELDARRFDPMTQRTRLDAAVAGFLGG